MESTITVFHLLDLEGWLVKSHKQSIVGINGIEIFTFIVKKDFFFFFFKSVLLNYQEEL